MIVKNFDTVFKEQKKINVSKEYIVKNVFDLRNIKNDIHYIRTIKIQPYSKTNEINKLMQNNFINITIGGYNNIFNNNELLSILASPKMIDELTGIKYEKILEDYNDYLIGGYYTKKLEICYIENKDNLYSLKFTIPRDGDLIYKIKISNKLFKFDPYKLINLTITLDKYYLEYLYDLYLDIGYCYCNNPLRREVLTTDMELKLE